MVAFVAFVPLFVITWLFCVFAALLLSKYILRKPFWMVPLLWVIAILLLLILLIKVGFIGSTENDRHLYVFLVLPLIVFPPIMSLVVAKQKTFIRHLAVVAGSFALAAPVASTWLLLFN